MQRDMRAWFCTVCLAALASCGDKSRPKEPVIACMRAHLEYWIHSHSHPFMPVVSYEPLACPDLYSKPECGAAWTALFRLADTAEPPLDRVATACARAYCDRLPAPRPRLCSQSGTSMKEEAFVAALIELDTAILTLEIGIPDLAASLAQKSAVFRPIEIPRATAIPLPAKPQQDASRTLVVSLARGSLALDGKTITDSELAATIERDCTTHPDTPPKVTIRASEDVPYARVIEIIDLTQKAGAIQFALEPVATPE